MKACKIILIIIFVIKSIIALIKVWIVDDENQFARLLGTLTGIAITGLLYKGAGIFDI